MLYKLIQSTVKYTRPHTLADTKLNNTGHSYTLSYTFYLVSL